MEYLKVLMDNFRLAPERVYSFQAQYYGIHPGKGFLWAVYGINLVRCSSH